MVDLSFASPGFPVPTRPVANLRLSMHGSARDELIDELLDWNTK